MPDLPPPPDLATLRRHAIEARDGVDFGGIRMPPTTFVTVHWAVMLAVLDAVDPQRLPVAWRTTHVARPTPPPSTDEARKLCEEANRAIAGGADVLELRRVVGRLVRQIHTLTERPAA